MAYTEPTPLTGYVQGRMLSKMQLLRRYIYGFGLDEFFTRVGPNFTFHLPGTVATYEVDCDIVPADRNNSTRTVTGHERATRDCLTELERNNIQNFNGAGRAKLEAQADALDLYAEQQLDALLVTSTNTVRLGTDNQMTREEYLKGVATIQKYSDLSNMVAWTSSVALYADLLDNSLATEAEVVLMDGVTATVAKLPFGVPLIISAQATNSASTGGTAMYLWNRNGIIGAYDGVETAMDETFSTLTGGYNILSKAIFAFDFVEGVADPRVVRFDNP